MEYQLAQETWKDREVISIYDDTGRFLAEFPISFVRQGGVGTWRYILKVLALILESVSGGTLIAHDGRVMEEHAAIEPGDFTLKVDREFCIISSLTKQPLL